MNRCSSESQSLSLDINGYSSETPAVCFSLDSLSLGLHSQRVSPDINGYKEPQRCVNTNGSNFARQKCRYKPQAYSFSTVSPHKLYIHTIVLPHNMKEKTDGFGICNICLSADCTLEVHITKKNAGGVTKQITRNVAADMTARLLVPSSEWQEKNTYGRKNYTYMQST
jgi:hypothetical protein